MLLQTKFYRPLIPRDYVARPRLIKEIEQGRNRSLTLISAPAGYGKTMLASSFLETCALPYAWLTLDQNDNDLGSFLGYLHAAIEIAVPGSLPRTQLFLAGAHLPSLSVIADSLVNDLVELKCEFILVLDDLHVIHEAEIYQLLAALLRHPLKGLHLILLTRQDPPLALGHLRAYDQMTELRTRDLRFTTEETAAFMGKAVATTWLLDDALTVLAERTEGWATGLRLAALTLRYGGDIDPQTAGLHAENRYVMDYLVNEVLTHVPAEIEEFLVKTSILDTLCGSLCDAVVAVDGDGRPGQRYLHLLEEANLFTVALDEQRIWYRYHHLFQGLLHSRLLHRLDACEVDDLHRRASAWYATHDLVEVALQHALAGHDTPLAVGLVAQHRHTLLNTEQRPQLARWLRWFPATTVAQHPELLLSNAWIAELSHLDSRTVLESVEQAQALVDRMAGQEERARQLQGEIDALRSIEKTFAANDPQGVIALASRALETMPPEWYMARVEAWLELAAGYLMCGQLERAYETFEVATREEIASNGAPRARLLASRCFIDWVAADLAATLRWAQNAISAGQITDQQRESLGWGHYFFASASYQRNDLDAAEAHANLVYEQRHACHLLPVVQSVIVLASVYQARGMPDQARHALDRVSGYLAEINNETLLPLVQAFRAELASMQGDFETASRWATMIGPRLPYGVMAAFYAPQFTLPKVLLRMNTPASLEQAAAALARLHAFVAATHNTRFTIEVLALEALCDDARGNEAAALQALEQAVTLAQPGGFIRVFLDLGAAMAGLMERLILRRGATEYLMQILTAFPQFSSHPSHPPSRSGQSARQGGLVESLTDRELDVLLLLAQRLTAQEIAQRLTISPGTVKRHVGNIYAKLSVNKRRDAVAAAIALGILPPQP